MTKKSYKNILLLKLFFYNSGNNAIGPEGGKAIGECLTNLTILKELNLELRLYNYNFI